MLLYTSSSIVREDPVLLRGFLTQRHSCITVSTARAPFHDNHHHASYSLSNFLTMVWSSSTPAQGKYILNFHTSVIWNGPEHQQCGQCSCTLGGNSSHFKNPKRQVHLRMPDQHTAETDCMPHCLNLKQATDLASSDPS